MTDAAAATAVPPPAAPATPAKSGIATRTYLLAGCSIGGTLCASLASSSSINLPFAILSAVFGGMIVLLTAAPGIVASAPGAAVPGPIGTAQALAKPSGTGAISIGIAAAVLSFIMNQIAQFAVGYTAYGIAGTELTPDQMFMLANIVGSSVIIIRVPFDLLIGAYLVSRARNVFGALGMFAVAYLVCYLIEQAVSAAFGMSGLYMTAMQGGVEAVLWGFGWVLGLPLICQTIGALGAKATAFFMRRKG
jgi:hypothetical protein